MEKLFLSILNISIRSAVLILCILLIRKAVGKRCNRIMCILWTCVAIRFLMPFLFEIPGLPYIALTGNKQAETDWEDKISKIPVRELYETKIASGNEQKAEQTSVPGENSNENNQPLPASSENATQKDSPLNSPEKLRGNRSSSLVMVFAVIWAGGMFAFLLYNLVSLLLLRKKLAEGTHDEGVVLCDGIAQPFVFGVLWPRIYIPSGVEESVKENAIAHERIHIQRGDHLIRILWTVVLSVHWFNPMAWVAFWKSDCDMEMSCDDAVTKGMSGEEREGYLASILRCSRKVARRQYMVGFSAGHMRERAENIVRPKHAGKILSVACLFVGLVFLVTSCATAGKKGKASKAVSFSARTLVCGEDYVAQILPGGTVRVTMIEESEGICEINPKEVQTWTGICTLRAGVGVLYGIDQNGKLHSSSRLNEKMQEYLETGSIPNLPWSFSQQIKTLPALKQFVGEAEMLDGRVFELRPQVMLSKDGTMTVFDLTGVFADSDETRVSLSEKHVAAYVDSIFLREDGTVGCIDEMSAKRKGVEKLKEKFCGIAENEISVFGLLENGRVVSGSTFYEGLVDRWENVTQICAAGEVVVALHEDGTVSMTLTNRQTDIRTETVEMWNNITEIATNGNVVAGMTKDGKVLIAGVTKTEETNVSEIRLMSLMAISFYQGAAEITVSGKGKTYEITASDGCLGSFSLGFHKTSTVSVSTDDETIGVNLFGPGEDEEKKTFGPLDADRVLLRIIVREGERISGYALVAFWEKSDGPAESPLFMSGKVLKEVSFRKKDGGYPNVTLQEVNALLDQAEKIYATEDLFKTSYGIVR